MQIAELVLLLVVDSLLQLLLLQQHTLTAPQGLAEGFNALMMADALFLAVPLLLYAFDSWPPTEKKAEARGEQQAIEHEERIAAFSAASAAFAAAATAVADSPGPLTASQSAELSAVAQSVTNLT